MNPVEDDAAILRILRESRRIAVLGIKVAAESYKPAYYVPAYLQRVGYKIVPVPVYFPDATEILGEPVYRAVSAVPGPVDLVLVFRRSPDIPPHVDDLLARAPAAVWFQSGIRHDGAARRLADAGIAVVQDRCAMVEHGRLV